MATNDDKKKNMHRHKASLPVPGIHKGRTPENSTSGQSARPKRTVRENVPSLRERETDLIGILNATQESIWLFSADGTLRMANRIALKRFGKSAEKVIGKHVNDLVPPKLAKARLARLQEVVRTGTPVEFEDMRAGILFRHTFSPVFDTTGNVTDVAIFSRDITGERKNEERLSYLASFPQLNPNPVLEADLTGAVTFANPATYRTLEHLGLDITNTKAFVPSDLNDVLAAWDRKHPATVDGEVRIADRVFTTSAYLDPGLGVARIYAYDITERKQTEEALRRSEAQFRTLADSIPNLAWWANGDGYITWYNRRWYEYTGTTPEQMEGWGWKSVHDPKVLPEVLERWKASISTAEPFEMEFPLRGADGVFRTFLTRVLPLKDPAGRALRWFGTNTDVSALKLAEDAMRESERRERERAEELATMLEAVPTPVVIVHDPDSTHMTGNRAADELLRQPRGAETSLSAPPEVKPRHFKAIKDGRELKLDELPAQRAARGEVVRDFEFNLVFDDGATRSLLGYGTPLLDKQGRPRGAVHVLVDITERKKIEETLRLSLDRYRSYIDVTGQLGWTTNAEGKVEEDIPSWRAYTGQSYDDIKGWGWSQALHPDDLERTSRVWKEAVATNKPYEVEYRLRRHDGIYRQFMARGIPLLNSEGNVREWVGTCIDITERKQAEEALKKAHNELEQRVEERTRELRIASDQVRTERQRMYSVLETLPVYVILLDKDHRIPFANRFFRQRFGEPGGRRCYEYLFNRTEACTTCETYTVQKTNAPHHWYWTGPDERSYDIYDYPFVDSDGSRLILEMGIDITDQKKAQQALRETITVLRQAEQRTLLINDLLTLFTREPERTAFLDAAIDRIRRWSGLRHVGIRVADDGREHSLRLLHRVQRRVPGLGADAFTGAGPLRMHPGGPGGSRTSGPARHDTRGVLLFEQ